jgi:hypothetical protein
MVESAVGSRGMVVRSATRGSRRPHLSTGAFLSVARATLPKGGFSTFPPPLSLLSLKTDPAFEDREVEKR